MPSAAPAAPAVLLTALLVLGAACETEPETTGAGVGGPPALEDASRAHPAVRARIEALRATILEAPEDARARFELAQVFDANDLYDLAWRAYQDAVQCAPDDARAWYHLGRIEAELGMQESAVRRFARASELADYAPAYWRAGLAFLELDRLDEAEVCFRRAFEGAPHDVSGALGLARVALQRGDVDAAVEFLAGILARVPNDGQANRLAARAYRALGRETEAVQALSFVESPSAAWRDPWLLETMRHATGDREAIARAQALLAAGQTQRALDVLLPLVEAHPEEVTLHNMVASAHIATRDFRAALEAIDRALEHHPEHFQPSLNRGVVLHLQGRLSESVIELERAVELHPAHGPTHFYLGRVLLQRGDAAAAVREFEIAISLGHDPGELDELLTVARAEAGR